MRIAAGADTRTAIWQLFGDSRLSAGARTAISDAATNRHKIAVSSISPVEVAYPVEKNRIPVTAYDDLTQAPEDPEHVFTEAVLTREVVNAMRRVAREDVPDMPDRIVPATGIDFNVPVISSDGKIRNARITTIW